MFKVNINNEKISSGGLVELYKQLTCYHSVAGSSSADFCDFTIDCIYTLIEVLELLNIKQPLIISLLKIE